jgi:pimeloyl-ACP methyl ester carboxylesterase
VATDVVSHLPPDTLSGVISLAGVADTGIIAEMAAPALIAVVPALVSAENVTAHQAASAMFTDRFFSSPDAVSFAVQCLHKGHSLSPEIMGICLSRPMTVEKLWEAGKAGLPYLIVEGTKDGHREGGAKSIDEIMRPHFKNYEIIWLEGRGHALHAECPDKVVEILISFTGRVGRTVSYINF